MPKREAFKPDWPRLAGRGRPYSPAVKKGNLLFISGMTSYDREGNKVGLGDLVAQTRQIFENMKDVLEAAGATFDDVVKTVDYIVPEVLPNYKATAQIRREYFKDNFPAATGVVVNRLLSKESLIEIDAVAVVD